MSDIITGIMIKNMAREMVRKATVKNAAYFVEYVKSGTNKQKDFNSFEDAERWAKASGLKRSRDPKDENEYRIVQQ